MFRKRLNLKTEGRKVGQDTTEIIEFETAFTASSIRKRNLPPFHVAVPLLNFGRTNYAYNAVFVCFPSFTPHLLSARDAKTTLYMPRKDTATLPIVMTLYHCRQSVPVYRISSIHKIKILEPRSWVTSPFSRLTLRTPLHWNVATSRQYSISVTFLTQLNGESSYVIFFRGQGNSSTFIWQCLSRNSSLSSDLPPNHTYTLLPTPTLADRDTDGGDQT